MKIKLLKRKDRPNWYADLREYGWGKRATSYPKTEVNRNEARDEALRFLQKFGLKHSPKRSSPYTLSGLIEQYLAHSKANNSEAVYVRDCHTLNDFGAFIGDHLLTDITPRHIERWKDWRSQQKGRRETHLSPTTINRDLNTIRAMFNLAVMWRMMEESPLRFVKNKKTQQALPKPYSEEEIHKILAASPEPWRTIWLIFLNTGMRRGEVQANALESYQGRADSRPTGERRKGESDPNFARIK